MGYVVHPGPDFLVIRILDPSLSQVPEIEVHIAEHNLKPGGVGEPVFPSVAPAVANAIFNPTGVRLRELPVNRELLV